MQFPLKPLTVPFVAIALLIVSTTKSFGESGLQGSYGGVPIDVNSLLQNSAIAPTPENLATAAIRGILQVPGVTPSFNPAPITPTTGVGVQFQGRYDLPNSPLSIRGSAYFGDDAKAVMPTVTYDLPIANNTNIYAGAGFSVVNAEGKTTPLGARTGVVVTTGVETQISQGIVLYGDAKLVPGNQDAKNPKLRYQVGVGYRF